MGIAGVIPLAAEPPGLQAETPISTTQDGILAPRGLFMPSFGPGRLGWSADLRGGGPVHPVALPALRRATRLFGLVLGSALGRLRESGATAVRLFARAEESALLLRMAREAAEILGARWDKGPSAIGPTTSRSSVTGSSESGIFSAFLSGRQRCCFGCRSKRSRDGRRTP
jgi:hypothetical protein